MTSKPIDSLGLYGRYSGMRHDSAEDKILIFFHG